MDYPLKPIDALGKTIATGDKVLFKIAPEWLLNDLPIEDQSAIKAQEGKPMEIIGFSEYGYAEMEFTSIDGNFHTIWVKPEELFKV